MLCLSGSPLAEISSFRLSFKCSFFYCYGQILEVIESVNARIFNSTILYETFQTFKDIALYINLVLMFQGIQPPVLVFVSGHSATSLGVCFRAFSRQSWCLFQGIQPPVLVFVSVHSAASLGVCFRAFSHQSWCLFQGI